MKIDEIIRTKRKTIALLVLRDGRLVVRAPLRTSRRLIEQVVAEKEAWILHQQQQMKLLPAMTSRKYVEGERLWFLGKEIPLRIVDHGPTRLTYKDEFFLRKDASHEAEAVFRLWYQRQAKALLSLRVEELSKQVGLTPKKLRISSARTRWGSCSSKGTISLSWRLVMAPPAAADYVIIHELAHLREHNHSPKFWKLVSELMPGYERWKKWLKENGERLRL